MLTVFTWPTASAKRASSGRLASTFTYLSVYWRLSCSTAIMARAVGPGRERKRATDLKLWLKPRRVAMTWGTPHGRVFAGDRRMGSPPRAAMMAMTPAAVRMPAAARTRHAPQGLDCQGAGAG